MADFHWASGLLLGLSAGIAPGPLLTLVVSQTLRFGMREGMKVALAPLITDLPIIIGALTFGALIAGRSLLLGLLSLTGAMYIGFLAWESISVTRATQELSASAPKSLRKGILANLLNPHPYLFWLTVGAPLVISAWAASPWNALIWLSGFYFMLVGAKVVAALLTGQARQWLYGKGYIWLNRSLGVALLLFALILVKEGLRQIGVIAP